MDKKPSFLWALAIGALFPILKVLISLLGISSLNEDMQIIDYLFFFIAGALIGLGVIYFLRRSETKSAYRGTMIGFIIGIPLALFGMMMGGWLGPLGVILLSISPGIFTTTVGYFIGRTFSKNKNS